SNTPLYLDGGAQGGEGIGEDGAEAVAVRLEDASPMRFDDALEQRVMAVAKRLHRLRVLLPQPRPPPDVGEQEGERLGRLREEGGELIRRGCAALRLLAQTLEQRARLRGGIGVQFSAQPQPELAIQQRHAGLVAAPR